MTSQPANRPRRGSIIHEAAIAIVLVSALLLAVVQILALGTQQERARQKRTAATREAGNLMEQLMADSWDQLTKDRTDKLTLSEHCQAVLPDANLKIEVTTDDDGAKQVAIQIAWQLDANNPVAPVHLVAWKYRPQETQP